jgi:Heavy metal binding domain
VGETTAKTRTSRLVAYWRAAVLLAAAGAAVAAVVMTGRHDSEISSSRVQYVCPMHRDVTARRSGDCPICGMALEKIRPGDRNDSSAATGRNDASLTATDLFLVASKAPNPPRYSTDIVRHHVLHQEPDAPAWIESDGLVNVLLYKDELSSLTPDESAVFFSTANPNAGLAAHAVVGSTTPWDSSMSLVRFRLDARARGAQPPPPHTSGWVELARKPRDVLVVPSMAVLQSAQGPYVLALSRDRSAFSKRGIEIGKAFSGFTAVVAGVNPRELVVSMNTFFVEAERRLRAERRSADEIRR